MLRTYLKSSLGPLRVTDVDDAAEIGIAVDSELLAAAHIMPGERVRVLWGGGAFEVYIVPARRGTGTVRVGGGGPGVGEVVRVTTECLLVDREALEHNARVVEVDAQNKVVPESH